MKWEYKMVSQSGAGNTIGEIEKFLGGYGNIGWELCAIDYGCFIFKRQIKE